MDSKGSVGRCLVWALLLLPLATPTSVGLARKRAPVRYGIPKLAPGQIWVSSVPAGLEVRAGEDPLAKKVIGRTPIVLKAKDVGAHVTVSITKKEWGAELPDQVELMDLFAKNTNSSLINYGTYQTDVSRSLTYRVPLPGKNSVIALFQTRPLSLKQAGRLYPQGSNFRFDHAAIEKQLATKGVPPDFIQAGIRLLERGGKVALPGARGWLVAEVISSGKVEVIEAPAQPPG
jgi:hypothetical protein